MQTVVGEAIYCIDRPRSGSSLGKMILLHQTVFHIPTDVNVRAIA